MQLNLADPDSIVAWWRVLPDRHDGYLAFKLTASPEFAPAIGEARRRIAADPALAALQAQAAQRTREHEARQAERREGMSARELLHQELATA